MSQLAVSTPISKPAAGIAFILLGVATISINDMLIKQLSDGYPLHQMAFARSVIGILFSLVFLSFEGGFAALRTGTPFMHAARGLLVVIANLSFFAALAVAPLGEATALFFVAPLMITLLSIPLLGETVGPFRIGAAIVGFVGVVIMLRPWESGSERETGILILLLPVFAAFAYSLFQIVTRKLGATTRASAMAIYIQGMFILVSLGFFVVAGDGRYAGTTENESLRFLLRRWMWPQGSDLWLFLALGLINAVAAYSLSSAYRLAGAATIAPFEYIGLPLAVMWGFLFWGEIPDGTVTLGIALIVGSGLFVFLRERQKKRRFVSARRAQRRY